MGANFIIAAVPKKTFQLAGDDRTVDGGADEAQADGKLCSNFICIQKFALS